MFERFSPAARDSVLQAQVVARELRQPMIGSEHVLLGVLWQDSGPAREALVAAGLDYPTARERLAQLVGDELDPQALASLGIDLDEIRSRVERTFGEGALDGPDRRPEPRGHIPFSKGAKKALELSLREAINLRSGGIDAEHVLLGVLGDVGSLAHRLLESFAVDPIRLRNDLRGRLRASA
ncbi:Clp protease N-terminal domain-containing protein [Microlunatus speluncae]|uniref:Clp protease N-terminal domain-containing protein n=1 Tax=Microlunatus speluncae TaxID=2594267 RepID=UPI0012665AA3|nr:Clp protease N-terminal domain-containing protein [Microlunatus speluncae]